MKRISDEDLLSGDILQYPFGPSHARSATLVIQIARFECYDYDYYKDVTYSRSGVRVSALTKSIDDIDMSEEVDCCFLVEREQ